MEMLVDNCRLMAHVSYISGRYSGDDCTIEPCGRPLDWNAVCIRVSHVLSTDVSAVPRIIQQGRECIPLTCECERKRKRVGSDGTELARPILKERRGRAIRY